MELSRPANVKRRALRGARGAAVPLVGFSDGLNLSLREAELAMVESVGGMMAGDEERWRWFDSGPMKKRHTIMGH